MIVEMKKLSLAAIDSDRDRILNALQKTGAVEITMQTPLADTAEVAFDGEELDARLSAAEAALAVLAAFAENYNKEHKIKTDELKDGFSVGYAQFMEAGGLREKEEALISRIGNLTDEKNRLKTEFARVGKAKEGAKLYKSLSLPFSAYADTAHTRVRLGTMSASSWENAKDAFDAVPLADVSCLSDGETVVLAAVFHASVAEEGEAILSSGGFAPCPYASDESGAEYFEKLSRESIRLGIAIRENEANFSGLIPEVRALKIYCDYLGFELEKARLAEKMRGTEKTFLLEAYVPQGAEERVQEALSAASSAYYCAFSEVGEEEEPPTLLRNNPVVENFETITNMYSPPKARELDPNTVMSFFYSVFLGFIMADIGYGLLMVLAGGFLCFKLRSRGGTMKSLGGVFAVGGIFAIVWGVFFNSLFGISIFPSDAPFLLPVAYDLTDSSYASWSFMGISIPAVLVLALLVGIFQLMTGYVCRAVQCWRRKQILDGILDGVVWAVFSLGVLLAVLGLIEDFALSSLTMIGGIAAGAMLAVAVLTAGRKEKLLGKFTKGFGSLYGIINYCSDILSYARLYGLMLSGAVIAQIVSKYAIGFITGGNAVFVIVGILLMIVGHAFNLAIGLLGAYIHDARLQYVEFYGRFYEGEGELFTPLGSKHKYIRVEPERSVSEKYEAA